MDKDDKVISIDDIKREKYKEELPKFFALEDAEEFSKMIEECLNSFYNLALEDEKYHSVCTTEQLKILSNVYTSFFKILYSELDDFDYSDESNRIMSKFLSELYRICDNLPDIEEIKENIDNNNLKM
jgi:ATP-dependent helicase/DNAse subunit B